MEDWFVAELYRGIVRLLECLRAARLAHA
jgi:hypothetical protein